MTTLEKMICDEIKRRPGTKQDILKSLKGKYWRGVMSTEYQMQCKRIDAAWASLVLRHDINYEPGKEVTIHDKSRSDRKA